MVDRDCQNELGLGVVVFRSWGRQSLHSKPLLQQISVFLVLDYVHFGKYRTPVKERASSF